MLYSGIATMVLLNLRNFRAHRRPFIKNHLRFDHVSPFAPAPAPVEPVLFWLLLMYTFNNLK